MGRKKVVDLSIDPNENLEKEVNLKEELDTLNEEEASAKSPDEPSMEAGMNIDENEIEAELIEKGADTEDAVPAELEVHTDNTTARELNREAGLEVEDKPKDEEKIKKVQKPKKQVKIRSKRYQAILEKIDRNKYYPIDEAIELVKECANTKFEATIEAHIGLNIKKAKNKATENVRGIVKLPSGLVKKPKVVILNEENAEKISKSGKVDFDIALAHPEMMPKIARLAKILGPKGKMPNPKIGTVTDDPKKTKEEIEAGRIEYRADSFNIVHLGIGKSSWESEKIKDNYLAILAVLAKFKVKSITLASTMGPGIKVKLEK